MWWDTAQYQHVWNTVIDQDIDFFVHKYRGDQDFVSDVIPIAYRRFFHAEWVKSWKWECVDGGFDFARKKHRSPGTGTNIGTDTSILVFHGRPKPHEIADAAVISHWQ
jgi:hypothetical protein